MKNLKNAPNNYQSSSGNQPIESPEQSLQSHAFAGIEVTRDQIRNGLSRDLRSLFVVLQEVLRSTECIDALTDVYYARYQRLKETESNIPTSDQVENG